MEPTGLPPSVFGWTRDHTMRHLNANPLPETFRWPHRDGGERIVQPSHKNVTGYGKWLRETPYFQGLFERVHEICARSDALGDGDWLAGKIKKFSASAEQDKLPF
jgi:hypothetical protein